MAPRWRRPHFSACGGGGGRMSSVAAGSEASKEGPAKEDCSICLEPLEGDKVIGTINSCTHEFW